MSVIYLDVKIHLTDDPGCRHTVMPPRPSIPCRRRRVGQSRRRVAAAHRPGRRRSEASDALRSADADHARWPSTRGVAGRARLGRRHPRPRDAGSLRHCVAPIASRIRARRPRPRAPRPPAPSSPSRRRAVPRLTESPRGRRQASASLVAWSAASATSTAAPGSRTASTREGREPTAQRGSPPCTRRTQANPPLDPGPGACGDAVVSAGTSARTGVRGAQPAAVTPVPAASVKSARRARRVRSSPAPTRG